MAVTKRNLIGISVVAASITAATILTISFSGGGGGGGHYDTALEDRKSVV